MSLLRRRMMGGLKKAVDVEDYLTIEALEDNLTVAFTNDCEYCVDGNGNWISLPSNTATEPISAGQKILFKAELTPGYDSGIGSFIVNKRFNLVGNAMSMLFGNDGKNHDSLAGYKYAFKYLFKDCDTLVSVSSGFLPATTLDESCYNGMFMRCSNLISAPDLPAAILVNYCYYYMFYNCESLSYIKMLATDTSASNCVTSWLYRVSSSGTFVKSKDYNSDKGIPSGWTVLNE